MTPKREELTHTTLAAGLRAAADWFESNQSIKLPYNPCLQILSVNTKAEVAELARQMGDCDKTISDSIFTVVKRFGPVEVRGVAYREQVCERIVVGYETVTVPAQPAKPEQTIAKEIVEWKCGSLMSSVEIDKTRLLEAPSTPLITEEVPF